MLKQLAASLLITSFDNQTCNNSVDNLQQTCRQQAVASHANASWHQLIDDMLLRWQMSIIIVIIFAQVHIKDYLLNEISTKDAKAQS